MNEHDLVTSLARIAEGAALAIKNRHNRPEMVANLEYAEANLRSVMRALAPKQQTAG